MKYLVVKDATGNELELSKIILGGAPLGDKVDQEISNQIMDEFVRAGGNAIDTARVYCDWLPDGHSLSEKTIGKWVKVRNNRDQIHIITKGGHPRLESMHISRLSREEIRQDIEESLAALQMEYVDIYLLHRDDSHSLVSEIMDVLHELVQEGKTKAIGVSNWSVERIIEANAYAREQGKTCISVSEIQWSLAECTEHTFKDKTMLCMNQEMYEQYKVLDLPVLAFSAQAQGVFSSGYPKGLENVENKHQKYVTPENSKRYENLLELCETKGYAPEAIALGYIVDNKLPAAAIIGYSSLEQVRKALGTLDVELTAEEIDELIER